MSGYIREKIIGEGTFGTVWLVKSAVSQNVYVMKAIKLIRMTEIEKERAFTEVTVLSKCRHNNIIRYKDSVYNHHIGSLSIFMEYADGGDLYTAIKKQKGVPFPENIVISWFIQISLALQYIHYSNILHRDLKCKNIFLTKNNVIKVGDFGIARVLRNSEDLATTNIGTPYYLSPEICKQQPYNCKTDMWALGCILFEMSALEHPFKATNFLQLVTAILRGDRRNLPDWSGPVVRELVDDLLKLDPVQRSSADEILANPSLQPYLTKFSTSKIPHLIDDKIFNNTKILRKEDSFKRASESNLSPEINKVRFTSTGKLHLHSSSPMAQKFDLKKTETYDNSSEISSKTQDRSALTKDDQCQSTLNTTFLVSSCAQNKGKFLSKSKNVCAKNCVGSQIYQSKTPISPCKVKTKQNGFRKESSNEKYEQKCLKEKIEVNVNNETKLLSTTSSNICVPKFPCKHSQCHQCMIDMLWKNRIRGCPKTTLNNEEYSELQNKLLSVFNKDKYSEVYHCLLKDWNDNGDLEISSKNYTKSLSYEQVQHLPLMMQLIQLDILRYSLVKGKKLS